MADIFLSYAREDTPRARRIAQALESHGWSVWWDRRIPHGQDFTAHIQQHLDAAACIVVLWSAAAIKSSFVRDEATEGLNGRLVPLLLEPVKQPLGFRQYQAADLTDWTGEGAHEEFDRVCQSIAALVAPPAPPRAEPRPHRPPPAPAAAPGAPFEFDVFVSYTHIDNVSLVEDRKGWVSDFRRALEVRLGQMLGRPAKIWMNDKLVGNDSMVDDDTAALRHAMFFVAVVTPRYVKSQWTQRELLEFDAVAARQGGLTLRGRSRLIKVLKTPVPFPDLPPLLQQTLGYEFYRLEPETGKVRSFDEVFGPESQREFWLRLDDLAHDLAGVLAHGPSA